MVQGFMTPLGHCLSESGAAEVGYACARMDLTRGAANELLPKILAKYEERIADAPLGSEFQECYDVAKAVPTHEYLDLYARVKEDLATTDLEFPYRDQRYVRAGLRSGRASRLGCWTHRENRIGLAAP